MTLETIEKESYVLSIFDFSGVKSSRDIWRYFREVHGVILVVNRTDFDGVAILKDATSSIEIFKKVKQY
jgi:hypothetical protein